MVTHSCPTTVGSGDGTARRGANRAAHCPVARPRTLMIGIAVACLLASHTRSRAENPSSLDSATVRVKTFDSGKPGPSVLVVAGGRRDQRFPLHALNQLGGWSLSAGKLVTVGIDAPSIPAALAARAAACDPDWIIELREDFYYPREGLATLGGSLIHADNAGLAEMSRALRDAINAELADPQGHFKWRLSNQTSSSFALSWGAQHGANAMLLVTSARRNTTPTRDLRAAVRIRQHRLLVHAALRRLEMLGPEARVDRFVNRDRAKTGSRKLYVAIYDGPGSGRPMPFVTDLMNGIPYVEAHPIHPVEIRSGGLESFDVALFPGGMASHQFDALEATGRRAVQGFVRRGGGYIGICAGAYMAATQPYTWGLGLLDAQIVDHDHWARGIGTVKIELTPAGQRVFGKRSGKFDYHYGNGPIFSPATQQDLPEYEVLAWYRTGIGVDGADPQVMVDTPAIISGRYGKGRVLVSSGHSEWSSGIEAFLLRYVEWTGGSQPPGAASNR